MIGTVEKVLVLSTKHMPESKPEFGNIRHCDHKHGYIVFVCLDLDPDEDYAKLVPAWLLPILRRCDEYGCSHVNFDCDAPTEPLLKAYEW